MKIIQGNLFDCDDKYDLGHCISMDCAMGAGIALEFRKKFPDMPDKIKMFIKMYNKHTPCTIGYKVESRVIFNLITKNKYYEKPTYDTIKVALVDLRVNMERHNRKFIAMPRIGCGLDKLKWEEVFKIIQSVFKDSDIEILIYSK